MGSDLTKSRDVRMVELADFVKDLQFLESHHLTWPTWVSRDLLFRALDGAVKRNEATTVQKALELTESCECNLRKCLTEGLRGETREKEAEAFNRNWKNARALVWCASQACNPPPSLKPLRVGKDLDAFRRSLEMERCCHALGTQEALAWGAILTFLDAPIRGQAVYVPVAESDEKAGKGFLNTLVLEVIETGANGVFHHPRDILATHWDPPFGDSIQDAWQAARALVGAEQETPLWDGRWRILSGWTADPLKRCELRPTAEANGPSASAAAAWGWWFALTGKVLDDRVITVAKINAQGVISAVDGIRLKVEAIVAAGAFDTIAVEHENVDEARKAVADAVKKRKIKPCDIRVVDIAEYKFPADGREPQDAPAKTSQPRRNE